MSDVQIENGYTKIANELLEVIYGTNFNSTQLKLLLCIIRYTYGFNRKSHAISISFLSSATGISRRYISSELNKLIDTKVVMIIQDYSVTSSRILKLNKNYVQWVGYGTILHQVNNTSTDEEQFTTPGEQYFTTTGEQLFTQEINIKENIKESSTKTFNEQTIEYQLSERLYKNILLNDSKAKKPNLEKWADYIDKLIRLDGRSIDEIEKVIDFSATDDFWKSNILSTKKLRDKFSQLFVKQQSKVISNNSTSTIKGNTSANWRGSDKRL